MVPRRFLGHLPDTFYQPLDTGNGVILESKRGKCRRRILNTQGRFYNTFFAVVICINAVLLALEADLGLLGNGSPRWNGLQADFKIVSDDGTKTILDGVESGVRAGLRSDGIFKQAMEQQMYDHFDRNVDIEDDLRLRKGDSHLQQGAYTVCELIFVVLYTAELLLRLLDESCRAFNKDWWTMFDFLLVLLGWADLALPFVLKAFDQVPSTTAFLILSVVRMTRPLRVARLFRVVKELRPMSRGWYTAFSKVIGVGVVLLIGNFILATWVTSTIGQHPHYWEDDAAEHISEWFGSIGRSMQTLFSIMTLSGWNHIAATLSTVIPISLVTFFFAIYIMLCFFALVGLLTGLVNTAFADTARQEEQLHLDEVEESRAAFAKVLTRVFIASDPNKSGCVTKAAFKDTLEQNPMVLRQLQTLDLQTSTDELLHLFDRLAQDSGTAGAVDIQSLVETMVLVDGVARSTEMFNVKYQLGGLRREMLGQVSAIRRDLAEERHRANMDVAARSAEISQLATSISKSLGTTNAAISGLRAETAAILSKVDALDKQRELDKASAANTTAGLSTKLDAMSIQVYSIGSISEKVDAITAHFAAQMAFNEHFQQLARQLSNDVSETVVAKLDALRQPCFAPADAQTKKGPESVYAFKDIDGIPRSPVGGIGSADGDAESTSVGGSCPGGRTNSRGGFVSGSAVVEAAEGSSLDGEERPASVSVTSPPTVSSAVALDWAASREAPIDGCSPVELHQQAAVEKLKSGPDERTNEEEFVPDE